MIKVGVAKISTFFEPSAAASTTAELAGLLKAAALGTPFAAAYCRFNRRPRHFCGHAGAK